MAGKHAAPKKVGKHAKAIVVTPQRQSAQRELMEFMSKPYDLWRFISFRTALVKYADSEGVGLAKAYDKVANG